MATKTKSPYKLLKVAYEDVDRETIENEKVVISTIDAETQRRIVMQCNEEYEIAYPFNEAKRSTQLARLKLYNNQRRDAGTVGDPLMFTVFNTIHAALYDDRLMASWEGRGGSGDEDVEENLNALSTFDYDIMGKSKLDYYWNWDAEFFGRGLLLMMEFDRTEGVMAPMPELIDPVTFIRDPRATSVNGDSHGRGALRFFGWEVGATYYEMKKNKSYFNLHLLKKEKEIKSLMSKARDARNEAQGRDMSDAQEESLGKYNNYEFNLLNWFTTIKGDKYMVTLANSRSVIVKMQKIKNQNRWPLIDRCFNPLSNDWDGVTIPDLTEDKQRAKAIITNLMLKSAKGDAMPQYLYDGLRITNKNDLNARFNKFIKVNGRVDNAIMPMQKATMHQYASLILDSIDQSAQRATATPEIQQGVPSEQSRTLGELNLVSSKVDTRYSMSAKVYGWSEREFWQQWYGMYKIHFKEDIDEKIIRIQGALAPVWRPLMRDNIISDIDPDVRIESKVISEAKRVRQQQAFGGFATIAMQDPDTNRRYLLKRYAKLNDMTKEEVDMALPLTVDELQAQDENDLLNTGNLPTISVQDNHLVHIEIHAKAEQSPETMAHIRAHKAMMVVKRDNPELFPPAQGLPADGQAMPQQPQAPATPAPTTPTQ